MDSVPHTTADAVAYVDEAGELGRTSRLRSQHDDQLGLFLALLFRGDTLPKAAAEFALPFQRFTESAPAGAHLHITDAFASGNGTWSGIAESVRDDAYKLVRRLAIPVIFEAQRLGAPRELRDALARIGERGAKTRHSGVEVKTPTTKEHIEETLLEMLLHKLEEYGAEFNLSTIDLRFDNVADGLFKRYKQKLEELREIDDATEEVTGYHRATGTVRRGETRIRIRGASLAVNRVARLTVAGKDDPLVLLVDIIANSLNDYLCQLDVQAPVDETIVARWTLGAAVWPSAEAPGPSSAHEPGD